MSASGDGEEEGICLPLGILKETKTEKGMKSANITINYKYLKSVLLCP
jgi:hypothetical protein